MASFGAAAVPRLDLGILFFPFCSACYFAASFLSIAVSSFPADRSCERREFLFSDYATVCWLPPRITRSISYVSSAIVSMFLDPFAV
jgi:hypothetical protein